MLLLAHRVKTMDPIAIIGSGPCIKDLHSPDMLAENRLCVAIHRGVRHVPNAHVLVLFDKICPEIFKEDIERFGGKIVRHRNVLMDAELFENVGARRLAGASLGFTMEYVLTAYPGRDVELYGVDLVYGKVIKARPRLCVPLIVNRVGGKNAVITNCCPSTKWDQYPIEERPWTASQ